MRRTWILFVALPVMLGFLFAGCKAEEKKDKQKPTLTITSPAETGESEEPPSVTVKEGLNITGVAEDDVELSSWFWKIEGLTSGESVPISGKKVAINDTVSIPEENVMENQQYTVKICCKDKAGNVSDTISREIILYLSL